LHVLLCVGASPVLRCVVQGHSRRSSLRPPRRAAPPAAAVLRGAAPEVALIASAFFGVQRAAQPFYVRRITEGALATQQEQRWMWGCSAPMRAPVDTHLMLRRRAGRAIERPAVLRAQSGAVRQGSRRAGRRTPCTCLWPVMCPHADCRSTDGTQTALAPRAVLSILLPLLIPFRAGVRAAVELRTSGGTVNHEAPTNWSRSDTLLPPAREIWASLLLCFDISPPRISLIPPWRALAPCAVRHGGGARDVLNSSTAPPSASGRRPRCCPSIDCRPGSSAKEQAAGAKRLCFVTSSLFCASAAAAARLPDRTRRRRCAGNWRLSSSPSHSPITPPRHHPLRCEAFTCSVSFIDVRHLASPQPMARAARRRHLPCVPSR
jgi:hypothetical protein